MSSTLGIAAPISGQQQHRGSFAELAGVVWIPTPSARMDDECEADGQQSFNGGSSPQLFVGGLAAAESADFLRSNGVTHVLSVAGGNLRVNLGGGESGCAGVGPGFEPLAHKTVEVADHPAADILAVLDEALSFMDDALSEGASGVVLVHCASGVSRSVTTVVAWLITRRKISLEHALALVRENRSQANPNLGFLKQLQVLEAENGSLERACVRWQNEGGATDVLAEAQKQREIVNSLHATVDALEIRVAEVLSSGVGTRCRPDEALMERRKLVSSLENLQAELDDCLPLDGEGYVDRPARMIRKSAVSKAERLLASLSE